MSGAQKNEIVARLAQILKIDYRELVAKRILQLMNQREVQELANDGVDFQLHTHRHRMPLNEEMLRKEIGENREWISQAAAGARRHFCYPKRRLPSRISQVACGGRHCVGYYLRYGPR